LAGFDPQVDLGPDSFPYFQAAIPDAGPFTPFSIVSVLDFTQEKGTGVAIFGDPARSEGPEWVFTYGNLLCYKLYGSFETGIQPQPGDNSKVLVSPPSEALLPAAARRTLGAFMRDKYQPRNTRR
jgi:hypothetical protein